MKLEKIEKLASGKKLSEKELELRLSGVIKGPPAYMEPSVDNIASILMPDLDTEAISKSTDDVVVVTAASAACVTDDSDIIEECSPESETKKGGRLRRLNIFRKR